VSPNIAGFKEAQERLREKLGFDIRFYTPLPKTYPPGTELDPETGKPYNATIRPTASGWASASVRCSVVSRPFGLSRTGIEDQTESTALGIMSNTSVGLIMSEEDWPTASGATEFEHLEIRYEIRDDTPDSLGGATRHIVVGEQK
jgi:hypothetical protein